MVRLTMTKALVVALDYCSKADDNTLLLIFHENEPLLDDPALGNPITHSQVLALSKQLRQHAEDASNAAKLKLEHVAYDLDSLLRGSEVYIEPPKPKPEPVR